MPPPDYKARVEIFKIHTRDKPLAKDVDLEELAKRTEGYTGADIASLVNTAALIALREHVEKYKDPKEAIKHKGELKITMKHFEKAFEKVKPPDTKEMEKYKRIAEEFARRQSIPYVS